MSSIRRTSALAAAVAVTLFGMVAAGARGATQTFSAPGSHSFQVPAGVTSLYVVAVGARGGNCHNDAGGSGASVAATVLVSPGQQLAVHVGGVGGGGGGLDCVPSSGGAGGVGGGGAGGAGRTFDRGGAGGGGASLIGAGAPDFNGLLVVAGGGGGASSLRDGGDAGSPGLSGYLDVATGGRAGTQTAGGAGGAGGNANATAGGSGTQLTGGVGGNADLTPHEGGGDVGGGGGGGGYYGGGGGGGGGSNFNYGDAGSGGGGSSFASPSATYVMPPAASSAPSGVTLIYPAPLPPTATIASPPWGGPYMVGQSVATSFSCGSGPVSCDDSAGTSTTNGGTGHLDTSTPGTHTYTVTATTADGLIATASIPYAVWYPPQAFVLSPAPGGIYQLGQFVLTSFTCVEKDGGLGLASCKDSAGASGTDSSLGVLDTSTPGAHTYTATATSKSRFTGTASISYSVVVPPARTAPVTPPDVAPPLPTRATTATIPAIALFKIEPSSFRAASSGPVTSPVRNGRVGARISYSLNVAGTVTFTVQRRKGTRYLTVGTFTKTAAKGGAVRFVFRGRVDKSKLAAGSYRLSAQPTTTAEQPSSPVRQTFTIVRR